MTTKQDIIRQSIYFAVCAAAFVVIVLSGIHWGVYG